MRAWSLAALLLLFLSAAEARAAEPDAAALVRGAIDYWRGQSSYSVARLTIHRPDWERSLKLRAWTRGEKLSLVRVIAPPKDEGTSTLLAGAEMWSYAPKVDRVIRLPSSMMSQGWLGSDFSNDDLAKSDRIVDDYLHRLTSIGTASGLKVYVIESTPKEDAPVVWGKEVLEVREDRLLLSHDFYDQSLRRVKRLETLEIRPIGGKLVAARMRMSKDAAPQEWTEIEVLEARFGLALDDALFTVSSLRNPRQ